MSWLSRLLGGGAQPEPGESPREVTSEAPRNVLISEITRGSDFWSAFVASGAGGLGGLSENTARTLPAVYSCVNLIAGGILSMPVDPGYRSNKGDFVKLQDDPLWYLLNEQFSPRWSASSAWEFACASLLLHGNAYIEIRRDAFGQVRALVPLHPGRVTVAITPDGERLVYAVAPETGLAGSVRALDQDDVIHVAGPGFDGRLGLSVLRHALRGAGAAANAMQEYAARFFANGARPDYTLSTDKLLSQDAVADLYARLEQFKGFADAHRPMVLTGGLKVDPLSMPLAEMQLLEGRKFQIEEIARLYGVPPFMIGHTEKTTSWGSGVDTMGMLFVRYTLRPWLTRFQNELDRKLFRQGRRCVRFDTTDLERADLKTLMAAIRTGLGRAGERPVITVNEGRRMMGLADAPEGGDSLEPLPAGTAPGTQDGNSDAQPAA
ncbi:MAG: phage portal protein [Proteobacteria bacterium]|nr:phage portal protein [Pseudomonadota bacterium]